MYSHGVSNGLPAGNAVKVPVTDRFVRTSAPNVRTSAHQDVYVCNLNKSGYMSPFIVINGISSTS